MSYSFKPERTKSFAYNLSIDVHGYMFTGTAHLLTDEDGIGIVTFRSGTEIGNQTKVTLPVQVTGHGKSKAVKIAAREVAHYLRYKDIPPSQTYSLKQQSRADHKRKKNRGKRTRTTTLSWRW